MNIDVSVIIPAWNLENSIKRAIDSLLNQKFNRNIEIIAVISESTDNTRKVVEDYQKEHKNVVLIDSDKKNPAYNRMLGVKKAKGKYICFLDADDYYHPNYVQVMFDEIEKGYDIVNCSFYLDRNGKISKNILTKVKEYDSLSACKGLLNEFTMRAFLWNKIFRKDLIDDPKVPFMKSKSVCFEDLPIVFYLYMKAKAVKSIKKPLYYYVNNTNSLTKKESSKRFNEHLCAYAVVRTLCDSSEDIRYRKAFINRMWRIKASLWFDGHDSRHVLGHGGLKELRLNKSTIKMLKSKEKLDVDSLPMKDFIHECLSPFE